MASEAPGYAPAEVLNTRFFGGEFGSGKVATPAKASRGVDHTSLLITPLNRGDGGRVAAPSPSILDRYFPRKTTSPGRSTGTAQLNNMATAATPPRCSTPSFSSKGSAAGHPLRSPLIGTSDIRSRLHTFSLTPPPSGSLLTPQTRTSSTGAEFSISALRAAKGSSLPGSAESIAARSRANQLQAELQAKDLEVKKLGAAASEARRQRDELLQHMELLSKEASAARAACQRAQASASLAGASPLATMPTSCHVPASHEQHALVEELRQQVAKLAAAVQTRDAELLQLRTQYDDPQKAVSASDGGEAGKAASQGNPETNAQAPSVPYKEVVSMAAALDELRQEREQSMSQVEVIAAQMHGLRARADAAEERVRLSEARCAAIEETHKVTDGELRRLQEQHAPQQAEIRRLTSELAAAQDRAALAESTLREERTRRDASKRDAADRSNASSLAETALAAQVRALAAQLQAAKGDAAAARQELRSLQGQAQGQSAAAEGATASLLSANRELEAALSTAADDLQARMAEVQEARATVAHLSSENAALHAALKDRATELGHATAAAAEGRRKVDALEAQVVSLQRDLRVAQGKVVQLEDAMARSGGGVAGSGPSPLRDVVGTLRNELQDRELRLATAEEELAAERRRAAELHRQALDQAVELDDLQREHAECKALGEQLAAARDAADAARKHADTLEAEVKDARRAAPGSGGDAAQLQHATAAATRLADENAALRQELEAREAEIMQLQGQLTLTSSGKEDDLNWLMDA